MAKTKRLASREGSAVVRVILAIVLIVSAFISIFPFLYMLALSLMETSTMKLSWERLISAKYTLDNYKMAFKNGAFLTYIKNSTIVTLYAVVVNCLVSAMAAYAFAKKKFFGSRTMYTLYLATMMVPGQVTLIPTFLILKEMGMLNTYSAVALPTCGAFGVLLIYSFMKQGVPDELMEAAELDGCSEVRKFTRIVLPLLKSVIISLAIFTFINVWGNLVLPLVVYTESDMTTITQAVANMKTSHTATKYGYIMAGNVIAFLPPFILYLFLQKQFVEGIALSGTKT